MDKLNKAVKLNYYKHNKIDCGNCPISYMCCTLKVKLSLLDRLKIFLKTGLPVKQYASKLTEDGFYCIEVKEGYCYFFERNGKPHCSIYSSRPKICRQFPHFHGDVNDCRDIFKRWKRHVVNDVETVEVEINTDSI